MDLSNPEMHKPVVHTDGGPWAFHDVACPVCSENKAIVYLNDGTFQPCSTCAEQGWTLYQMSKLQRKRKQWMSKLFY